MSESNGKTARGAAPSPGLPLVSVVIVNYNYGRFLADAVNSVRSQTYPRVECIVVDNASTDETPTILEQLRAEGEDLVVIARAANDGQTPASLDGLAAARGQYVIFLDADDYLLPKCVETHVFVHLSMRRHIGFTSGDMLQVVDGDVVVATGEETGRYILSGRGCKPKLTRVYTSSAGWPTSFSALEMIGKIHYVPPLKAHWIWSPTSGLCYRRDALRLFADNPLLSSLRTGTDLYFAFGCGGLSGSVIIDEPVFAYRIHGGNIYTSRAQLDRTLNFTIGGHGDSNIKAQLYLIDHLVEHAARFAPNLILKLNLVALLFKLDRHDIDPALPGWARRSRASQAMVKHWDAVAGVLGSALARVALFIFSGSPRGPTALARTLPKNV